MISALSGDDDLDAEDVACGFDMLAAGLEVVAGLVSAAVRR
jgi:hypothetical protein